MFINGINFPNQIIDAIKDQRFVVFAGAGASVDPPTSLPNFEKLAKEIAEGTGYELKKKESCEVFLGMLKSKGIPINEQAAEILSAACVEHNKLHEAIVDLFLVPEEIKIVTTNYDQMFEQVLASRDIQPTVFNIPAIPLGNDIQGIIHIHGNVNNPNYMIVTDEDFGRAYLTEGYASRFLVRLFESYTVLFIGYSYNDTILRYLSRAMSRRNSRNRYILTDDKKSDWSALGINPIWFPKRSYATMREALVKLGVIVKKGLLDWKNQLSEISDAPPKDLTVDTEIDYCLESVERSQVLANSVHGKAWILFFDRKKIFDRCFSNLVQLSKQDLLWGKWLCDNSVGSEDEILFQLVYKHNNCINKDFAEILIQTLSREKTIGNDAFSRYIVLLDKHLNNTWIISRLIEDLCQRGLYLLGFRLFKKLFCSKLLLQRSWFSEDLFEYKHTFDGSYYNIQHSWKLIKDIICKESAYAVLNFAHDKIEEVHNLYFFVEQASKDSEPWEMSQMVIEEREERNYRDDVLQILTQMYFDAAVCLQEQNLSMLRSSILQHLESESVLVRKLALRAMRITKVFNPKEVLEILLDNNYIDFAFTKEQVFLLVDETFRDFDEKDKNALIDAVESLGYNSDDRSENYKVYNWCIWLQRIDESNTRVNEIVTRLHKEFGFEPRKHPERNIETSNAVWIPDESPLSEEELMQQPIAEVANYLKTFEADNFDGPSRFGLLKVLSSCVSKDYFWTRSLVEELVDQRIKDQDIWQHLFNGIDNLDLTLNNSVDLIELLALHTADIGYDRNVAGLLFNILRRDDIRDAFSEFENKLYSVSEIIWNSRNHSAIDLDRVIDLTLNTTTGMIILSWIYMISYIKEPSIPDKFKTHFENVLKLRTWEKSVSVCILAGHFDFFCYRDKEWCVTHLASLLIENDKKAFSSAWEGLVFFSGRINKDTADILAPIYLKGIKHLDWLNSEVKTIFIDLLLTLLLYVIDRPTLKYIPEFYRSASENDIMTFINAIENRLRNMETQEKKKWWNNWLKHFLDNRKKSKPVPISEKENKAILNLLTELDAVFDDAVQTICRGIMPATVDDLFWFTFNEKKLARRNPRSTAIVVTKVLNSSKNASYDEMNIRKIVEDIDGLDNKEQRQLQEALLRKNIMI